MDTVQHRVFSLWMQNRGKFVTSVAELLAQDIRLMTIAQAKLGP